MSLEHFLLSRHPSLNPVCKSRLMERVLEVAKRLHGRGFVEVEVSLFSERGFLIDNLRFRIHWIIEMILVDRPCAIGV